MDGSGDPGRPYAEMTVPQLKQELQARGIDAKVGGQGSTTLSYDRCAQYAVCMFGVGSRGIDAKVRGGGMRTALRRLPHDGRYLCDIFVLGGGGCGQGSDARVGGQRGQRTFTVHHGRYLQHVVFVYVCFGGRQGH